MTLDNMTGITKASCTADDTFCKSQLITCNRVKECNGVCPFEDALKYADKMQTMNEKHTVDHDRDWVIGCIEHDGFIHTHRFDKANQIILDALSAGQGWIPCSERLPKEKARVLTYDTMGDIVFGQYDKGRWYWEAEACADYWAKNDGVIAWMPLPTPYKGGDDDE